MVSGVQQEREQFCDLEEVLGQCSVSHLSQSLVAVESGILFIIALGEGTWMRSGLTKQDFVLRRRSVFIEHVVNLWLWPASCHLEFGACVDDVR